MINDSLAQSTQTIINASETAPGRFGVRGYEVGHWMALETRRACQERMMRDCGGDI